MSRLKVPRKKIRGLMPLLDISRLQKNGRYVKERVGTVLEDQDTKLVHFIGKDNIVSLHYFPAMLKAEGSYILPDNVPANEFLNLEGNKLSTSKIGRFGCTNIW
jgi:methionyl-tRNA synthetase